MCGIYMIVALVWSMGACIGLNDANLHQILSQYREQGLFVFFWTDGCRDCDGARRVVDLIRDSGKYIDRVVFVDVDCSKNEKTCREFGVVNTPEVVFVSKRRDRSVPFRGSYEEEAIDMFIWKQLVFPVVFRNNTNEIDKSIDMASTYVLKYTDLWDKRVSVVGDAAASVFGSGARFYAVKGKAWKFTAFRSLDAYQGFRGEWKRSELDEFILRTFFPFMLELNTRTIKHLKMFNKMTLTAFIDPRRHLSSLKHIAQEIASQYPFTIVGPDDRNNLAKAVGVDWNNVPLFVLYDANKHQWIYYEGEVTETGLTEWLNTLGDLNRAQWYGPKHGLIDRLVLMSWTRLYVLLLFSFSVIGLAIFWMRRYGRRRPRRMGGSRGFQALVSV